MRLPSEQPSGEIVWETEEVVQRAEMTAWGQKRKSEATPEMSAPGGEADVNRRKADIELGMSAPGVTADISKERRDFRV